MKCILLLWNAHGIKYLQIAGISVSCWTSVCEQLWMMSICVRKSYINGYMKKYYMAINVSVTFKTKDNYFIESSPFTSSVIAFICEIVVFSFTFSCYVGVMLTNLVYFQEKYCRVKKYRFCYEMLHISFEILFRICQLMASFYCLLRGRSFRNCWHNWACGSITLVISIVDVIMKYNIELSSAVSRDSHGDVIKWKHFPRYWPFARGIHW